MIIIHAVVDYRPQTLSSNLYHSCKAARELVRMFGGAAFLSPHGAEHAATNDVMFRPLEEKGTFLKTQLVLRSDNTSTLVDEFVRSFIKRLTNDDLYQPELPHPTNGAVHAV